MKQTMKHWWLQVKSNIPKQAVYEEFQPTVGDIGWEWIKVVEAYHVADLEKKLEKAISALKEIRDSESGLYQFAEEAEDIAATTLNRIGGVEK